MSRNDEGDLLPSLPSYSDHSGDDARSDGICSLHHLLIQPSGDGNLWLVVIDVSYGKLLYGA